MTAGRPGYSLLNMADTKLFSSQMSNPLPGNARLTLKKSDGTEIGSYEPLGDDTELTLPEDAGDVFTATIYETSYNMVKDAFDAGKTVVAEDKLQRLRYGLVQANDLYFKFAHVDHGQNGRFALEAVYVDPNGVTVDQQWRRYSASVATTSDLNDFLTADDIKDFALKSLNVDINVEEDDSYTSRYTFNEVSAAITAGRFVYARLAMDSYQVVRHSPDEIVFATYRDTASTIDTITLHRDDSVTVKTTGLGSGGVLKAVFGETTYAEVADAIDNGEMVYVERSNSLFIAMSKTNNRIVFESLTFDGTVNIIRLELSSTNNWGQFVAQLARQDALPTKTSDLENDSGFIGAAELDAMAEKRIIVTTPPSSVTGLADYAGSLTQTNLYGWLFTVQTEVLLHADETKLSVLAAAPNNNNVSFGIFEYNFDGNEGLGATTWLCDTGKVNLKVGENRLPIVNISRATPTHPDIKLEPGKVYYAAMMVGPAIDPSQPISVSLAASAVLAYIDKSNPALSLSADMTSHVDWNTGSMENVWFQGYQPGNMPMPYMMIRNGDDLPVVVTDPFDNLEDFTLFNTYRVSDIFNMSSFGTRPAVYQKIIPMKDVNVKKITYIDYHASIKATNAPAIVGNNDTILVGRSGYTITKGDNDGSKLGQFYIHELTLNEPFTMLKNTPYWVPAGLNISNGTNEWVITYQNPSTIRRDLFICVDDGLIAPGSGAIERAYDQYAPFCRIMTDENVEYTF